MIKPYAITRILADIRMALKDLHSAKTEYPEHCLAYISDAKTALANGEYWEILEAVKELEAQYNTFVAFEYNGELIDCEPV